jgi:hypothetical protein
MAAANNFDPRTASLISSVTMTVFTKENSWQASALADMETGPDICFCAVYDF